MKKSHRFTPLPTDAGRNIPPNLCRSVAKKRILFTLDTPAIAPHVTGLVANKMEYAHRWGYEFRHFTRAHWPKISPVYSKIWHIADLLQRGYDTVIWLDADIGITDFTRDLGALLVRRQETEDRRQKTQDSGLRTQDYFLAGMRELGKHHPKYICAGILVVRNCPAARQLFARIVRRIEAGDNSNIVYRDLLREQRQINEELHAADYDGVHACTEDEIGSFWDQIKNPPVLRPWRPGDLTVHLGLAPWPQRARAWAAKYAPQVRRAAAANLPPFRPSIPLASVTDPPRALTAHELRKVKLFIGTPCNGGVAVGYAASLVVLTQHLDRAGIAWQLALPQGDSLVTRARTRMVPDFLASDCTHWFCPDSDIGFRPEDVVAMLQANLLLVGGAYPKKGINWEAVAERTLHGPFKAADLEDAGLDYCLNRLPSFQSSNLPSSSTLRSAIEVAEIGTGFWVIQRRVIEILQRAQPETEYADDYAQTRGRQTFHIFGDAIRNRRLLSEDYRVCQDWRALGGKVWCWPFAKLNHIGTYIFRGDYSRRVNATQPTTKEK